jgi:hypothetical protein
VRPWVKTPVPKKKKKKENSGKKKVKILSICRNNLNM